MEAAETSPAAVRRGSFFSGVAAALLGIGEGDAYKARENSGTPSSETRRGSHDFETEWRPRAQSHHSTVCGATSTSVNGRTRRPSGERTFMSRVRSRRNSCTDGPGSTHGSVHGSSSRGGGISHALEEILTRLKELEVPEGQLTGDALDSKLEEHQKRLEIANLVQMRKLQAAITGLTDVQQQQVNSDRQPCTSPPLLAPKTTSIPTTILRQALSISTIVSTLTKLETRISSGGSGGGGGGGISLGRGDAHQLHEQVQSSKEVAQLLAEDQHLEGMARLRVEKRPFSASLPMCPFSASVSTGPCLVPPGGKGAQGASQGSQPPHEAHGQLRLDGLPRGALRPCGGQQPPPLADPQDARASGKAQLAARAHPRRICRALVHHI